MASDLKFVEYVCEKIKDAGAIYYRRMYGNYALYCDEKFFALIVDNKFFIEITKSGKEFATDCKTANPFKGAKSYFLIEDFENKEFLTKLIQITCKELPRIKYKKIN